MGEGDEMSDTNQSEYRFAQDVALTAPKPGFHLATISFQVRDEVTILWVIEGPRNDEIGIVGNRTNFERTYVLRFSLRGSLIETVNGMYPLPYQRTMVFNFYQPDGQRPSPIGVDTATTVFSSLRAAGRPDPDSAAVTYSLSGRPLAYAHQNQVMAAITGYQRGWAHDQVVVAGACALYVISTPDAIGSAVTLTLEQVTGGLPAVITGNVGFGDSIMLTS